MYTIVPYEGFLWVLLYAFSDKMDKEHVVIAYIHEIMQIAGSRQDY